jgi:hypothetical protein
MNETTQATTARRRLPRFDSRARPGGEAWTSPLPDRLVALMGDAPEAVRHRDLAKHFAAAREKAIEIAAQLEKTRRDDAERVRVALRSGKQRPAPKAERIELELRQAREDVSLLADMLRDSADELLAAAVPRVEEARAAAEREAEAAIEEVGRLLEAVRSAIEEADLRAGESGWLGGFSATGIVWPWTERIRAIALPATRRHVTAALGSFPDDAQARAEHREERERLEALEATKKLPPGAYVFREGREFHVTEGGELEEVPR